LPSDDRSLDVNGGRTFGNLKVKFPHHRLILFLYLIVIVIVGLYLIIFIWVPTDISVKIDKTTVPAGPSISNATNAASPERAPVSVTTETVTSENATATVTTNNSFLLLKDGTKQLINTTQNVKNKVNITGFLPNTLLSESREIRLISISALFGLLGGAVSGINSLLHRRIWDSGKYVNIRRLLYNYYSRPWIAMSVGIVTYVTLRAGLLNVGTAGNISLISEYGVAAIAALVGLMTDEIIIRLRDIFRTLFGIPSLQKEPEIQLSLQKSSIRVNDQIEISAVLTDIRPSENQDLIAYFFIQDTNIVDTVPNTKREEKFSSTGVATVSIRGNSPGKTNITVILFGDDDLYDTKEIEVT
jgi:hypothetical protein